MGTPLGVQGVSRWPEDGALIEGILTSAEGGWRNALRTMNASKGRRRGSGGEGQAERVRLGKENGVLTMELSLDEDGEKDAQGPGEV